MRILEARFHDEKTSGPFIIVGHVYCDGPRAVIKPARDELERPDVQPIAPMVEKLRYLVQKSKPYPFEGLRGLRSNFWSFVEIEGDKA